MGKWTATIAKGKIGSNKTFDITSESTVGNAATVNGKNVNVEAKILSIGIP